MTDILLAILCAEVFAMLVLMGLLALRKDAPETTGSTPEADAPENSYKAQRDAAQSMEQGIENIMAFSIGGKTGFEEKEE